MLTGADLAGLAKLPSLVFFNACESARVRKLVEKTAFTTRDLQGRISRSVGLAEAFLRGGVADYLGTYWPVGDAAAEKFARVFYTALLGGECLGRAVQWARKEVNAISSADWADYLQVRQLRIRVEANTQSGGSAIFRSNWKPEELARVRSILRTSLAVSVAFGSGRNWDWVSTIQRDSRG